MKITLSKLIIENFKGIRKITVNFDNDTIISGDNGTGKSTVFDAFTWLLFGKDSHDTKDFNIKTLDASGNAIPQIDHSVTGILSVGDDDIALRRVYKEKWTRRRGSDDAELTGHETLFYWNDVPLLATEYKDKVANILTEEVFKLLTSPMYFNSLPWAQRRQTLTNIAGKIDITDVLMGIDKDKAAEIQAILGSGKKVAEFKKEVAVRKKKLSDDLKLIPSRIDEVRRTIPDPEPDYNSIEDAKAILQQEFDTLEATKLDRVKVYNEMAEEGRRTREEIATLRKQQSTIIIQVDSDYQRAISEANAIPAEQLRKFEAQRRKVAGLSGDISATQTRQKGLQEKVDRLRAEYDKVAEEEITFDEKNFACPTCKRAYPTDEIAIRKKQMTDNFESDRSRRLATITEEGKKTAAMLADVEKVVDDLATELGKESIVLKQMETQEMAPLAIPSKPDAKLLPEYLALQDTIDKLEAGITEIPPINTDDIAARQREIYNKKQELTIALSKKDDVAKAKQRISDLMLEEKGLAGQLADLEKKEFACESFTNAYMDLVEKRVNGMFKIVRFKMWNNLINGGTEETCECMVNGVPFSDVNSAGKIQAGIDIINAMSAYYSVWAPIFVDNAETVNELPPVQSQLIRLVVTKDQSLTIL